MNVGTLFTFAFFSSRLLTAFSLNPEAVTSWGYYEITSYYGKCHYLTGASNRFNDPENSMMYISDRSECLQQYNAFNPTQWYSRMEWPATSSKMAYCSSLVQYSSTAYMPPGCYISPSFWNFWMDKYDALTQQDKIKCQYQPVVNPQPYVDGGYYQTGCGWGANGCICRFPLSTGSTSAYQYKYKCGDVEKTAVNCFCGKSRGVICGANRYCYNYNNNVGDITEPECKTYGMCSNTDGSVHVGPCKCDSTDCSSSKPYCYNNMCKAYGHCTNTDGTQVNDGPCTCGGTDCSVATKNGDGTGLVCISNAAFNRCERPPTCEKRYGFFENTDNCKCGNVDCSTGTGLWCLESQHKCADTPINICPNIGGVNINEASCTCGDKTCDGGTYCVESESKCNANPLCANTNSTSKNDDDCICGASTCTFDTGLFCNATNDRCHYIGCAKTNGFISNAEQCECGASTCAPGLYCDTNTCSEIQTCEYTAGKQNNPVACHCGADTCPGDSYCTAELNVCAPLCSNTEGRIFNDIACVCGSRFCRNNGFCDTSESMCDDHPYCTNVNGFIENNQPCACGDRDCVAGTGLFCDASQHKCDTLPYCTNTDGSEANERNCRCGTAECDSEIGLFCHNDHCRHKQCAVSDGSSPNVGHCACGTDDCTRNNGLVCNAVDSICSADAVCTNTDGSVENVNACACGTTQCNDDTGFYCFSSQNTCRNVACTNVDGFIENNQLCACGNRDCDAGTGLFCDASQHKCDTLPYCTNTDGSEANERNCRCGTAECNFNNGYFCDASHSVCYKAPGPYFTSLGMSGPICSITDGTKENIAPCHCIADSAPPSGLGFTEKTICDSGLGLHCDLQQSDMCSKIQTCEHVNGIIKQENGNDCRCGSEICSSEQPYCTSEISKCSAYLPCTNVGGLVENEANCLCGNSDCDSSTGLWCNNIANSCQPFKGTWIPSLNKYTCADSTGTRPSMNPDECACAEAECSRNEFCNARLGVCSQTGEFTIGDETHAICPYSHGKYENGGKCLCGDAVCSRESGLYCEASSSECFLYRTDQGTDACVNVNGNIQNTAECKCGNVLCSAGMFCLESDNKCNNVPNCDGIAENSDNCYCGSTTCNCGGRNNCIEGQFCDVNRWRLELDQCSDKPQCTEVDGVSHNTLQCHCGTTTCTYDTGLICDAVTSQCSDIPKCKNTDSTAANTDFCSCGSTVCDLGTGLFCDSGQNRCSVLGPCFSTDGTVSNIQDCFCGTSTCTSDTGFFCDSSQNSCTLAGACTNTDPTIENDGACFCGTTTCTSDTGFFCDSSTNKCFEKIQWPQCTNQDATAQNAEFCKCEGAECKPGMFCVGNLEPQYTMITAGTCESHGMKNPIWDLEPFSSSTSGWEVCTQMFKAVFNTDYDGRAGSWYTVNVNYNYPFGCSVFQDPNTGLGFWRLNQDSTDTLECNNGVGVGCLCEMRCVPTPVCTNKDGSAANSADCTCGGAQCTAYNERFCYLNQQRCSKYAGCTREYGTIANDNSCLCGTSTCTSDTGLFCDSSQNSCTLAGVCTNTDATIENDGACFCGTTTCTSDTGFFCDSSTNKCFEKAACQNRDSNVVNDGSCACGDSICTYSTGLYCGSSNNCCSKMPGACSTGYAWVTSAGCEAMGTGFSMITTWQECETAADSLNFAAGGFSARPDYYRPAGCWKSNDVHEYLYFNTETDGPPTDKCVDFRSGGCLCAFEGPICNGDGTTPNAAECNCGSAVCSLETGLVCDVSNSACTQYDCPNTDASAENTIACQCGTAVCTTETGLLCTLDVNKCSAPQCANTDASVVNAASCQCGTSVCTEDTGFFCNSEINVCTNSAKADSCLNTDASVLNTNICTCGSTLCDANQFCSAVDNVCTFRDCANVDGSQANAYTCECGTSVCTEGLYCDYKHNHCHTVAGPYLKIYEVVTSGRCADIGFYDELDENSCKQGAEEMGYTLSSSSPYTTTGIYDQGLRPGCHIQNRNDGSVRLYGSTLYPAEVCHTRGDWMGCICSLIVTECENQDRSLLNDVACICGSKTCSTGFFCDAATSTCTAIDCPFAVGFDANSEFCQCGNTQCSANQYCISIQDRCETQKPEVVVLYPKCPSNPSTTVFARCACGTRGECAPGQYCNHEYSLCSDRISIFAVQKSGTCSVRITDESLCLPAWHEVTGDRRVPATLQCVNSGTCTEDSPCICWIGPSGQAQRMHYCNSGENNYSCTCARDGEPGEICSVGDTCPIGSNDKYCERPSSQMEKWPPEKFPAQSIKLGSTCNDASDCVSNCAVVNPKCYYGQILSSSEQTLAGNTHVQILSSSEQTLAGNTRLGKYWSNLTGYLEWYDDRGLCRPHSSPEKFKNVGTIICRDASDCPQVNMYGLPGSQYCDKTPPMGGTCSKVRDMPKYVSCKECESEDTLFPGIDIGDGKRYLQTYWDYMMDGALYQLYNIHGQDNCHERNQRNSDGEMVDKEYIKEKMAELKMMQCFSDSHCVLEVTEGVVLYSTINIDSYPACYILYTDYMGENRGFPLLYTPLELNAECVPPLPSELEPSPLWDASDLFRGDWFVTEEYGGRLVECSDDLFANKYDPRLDTSPLPSSVTCAGDTCFRTPKLPFEETRNRYCFHGELCVWDYIPKNQGWTRVNDKEYYRIEYECQSPEDTCSYLDTGVSVPCQSEKYAPVCPNGDGRVFNDMDSCKCGETTCTQISGLYCIAEVSRCTHMPSCEHKQGQVRNVETECTCSVDVCLNEYCNFAQQQCSGFQSCPNKDATRVNRRVCKCGNRICSGENGMYCIGNLERCYFSAICQSQEGENENADDCVCGSKECTSQTGFYCTASNSNCSPHPICSDTEGVDTTLVTCSCGTETCAFGDYCWADVDFCSPYPTCEVTDGTAVESQTCTCNTATCSVDDYCWAEVNYCSPYPECDDISGNETNADACTCGTVNCEGGDYCLKNSIKCSPHPACNSSPFVMNENACTCGIDDCTPGQFCNDGKCQDVPECVDGVNNGACTCAGASCTLSSGLHCESGVCSPGPCLATNGFEKNDASCMCLDDECAEGGFCHTNACNSYPKCPDTSGLVKNNKTCICGTAGDGLAVECYGYCSEALSQCSEDGLFTIGNEKAPICETAGSTSTTDTCFCNGELCKISDPGLICNADTSTCERPPVCNEILGLNVNQEYCACGSVDCHETTGLYCRASMNQCSKTGNFYREVDEGYFRLGRGSCKSVRYLEDAYTQNPFIYALQHPGKSCGDTAVPPLARLSRDKNYRDCLSDDNLDGRTDCDSVSGPAINCAYYNKWFDNYPPLGDGTTGPCVNSFVGENKKRPWAYSANDIKYESDDWDYSTDINKADRDDKMITTCMNRCRKLNPAVIQFQVRQFVYELFTGNDYVRNGRSGNINSKEYEAILLIEQDYMEAGNKYCVQYSPRTYLGDYNWLSSNYQYYRPGEVDREDVFFPNLFFTEKPCDENINGEQCTPFEMQTRLEVGTKQIQMEGLWEDRPVYIHEGLRTELRCNCILPASECDVSVHSYTNVYKIEVDTFPPRWNTSSDPVQECKTRCGTRQWFIREEDQRCACVGADEDCSTGDEDIMKFTRYASARDFPICKEGSNLEHCICGLNNALCEASVTGLQCQDSKTYDGTCSKPEQCNYDNGDIVNEKNCMCGAEECWSGIGFFCHTDHCLPLGSCKITNGTVANPDCFCNHEGDTTKCHAGDVFCNAELQQCRATADFDVYVITSGSVTVEEPSHSGSIYDTPDVNKCKKYTTIRTPEECKAAFEIRGFDSFMEYPCQIKSTQPVQVYDDTLPSGCVFRKDNSGCGAMYDLGSDYFNYKSEHILYFNTWGLDDNTNGNICREYPNVGPRGYRNLCLCNTPTTYPVCSQQKGYHEFTLNHEETCFCNAELCSWGQNKMVCDEGECTRPPACTDTTGNVENVNVDSCSCGNTHCMDKIKHGTGIPAPRAYDGFYCRISSVGPYHLADRCDIHPVCEEFHGTSVTDYTCMCAAKSCSPGKYCALGQVIEYGQDINVGSWSGGTYSPGVFDGPLCIHRDEMVDCACGSEYNVCKPRERTHPDTLNFAVSGDGLKCDFDSSSCLPPPFCANTDGTVLNDVDTCACGESDCYSDTGMYCFSDKSMCRKQPLCDDLFGSTAETNYCTCQHEMCSPGQYCHDDGVSYDDYISEFDEHGVTACRNHGKCLNQYGLTRNTAQCYCGKELCGANGYCFEGKCFPYPKCQHVDGLGRNVENCMCGSNECTNKQDYCHADRDDMCSTSPKCLYTNGVQANPDDCWCDTTPPLGPTTHTIYLDVDDGSESDVLKKTIVGLTANFDYEVSWKILRDSNSLINSVNLGGSGCSSSNKCSECQGDCDRDTDCEDGLKCFQRNTNGPVPTGCTGYMYSNYDYCYDPSYESGSFDSLWLNNIKAPSSGECLSQNPTDLCKFMTCSENTVATSDSSGELRVEAIFKGDLGGCHCDKKTDMCSETEPRTSKAAVQMTLTPKINGKRWIRCLDEPYCQNEQIGYERCDAFSNTFPVKTVFGVFYEPRCEANTVASKLCYCHGHDNGCFSGNYCHDSSYCSPYPKCQHNSGFEVEDTSCSCSEDNNCSPYPTPVCTADGTCDIPICKSGGSGILGLSPNPSMNCKCIMEGETSHQECAYNQYCLNPPATFDVDRGCVSEPIPRCYNSEGNEINDDGICVCGVGTDRIFCQDRQYCNAHHLQCSYNPNPSCASEDGNIPNGDFCLCGSEICSPFDYCDKNSATKKCYKQYCQDFMDMVPGFCNQIQTAEVIEEVDGKAVTVYKNIPYGNGLISTTKTCETTHLNGECTHESFTECCRLCPETNSFNRGIGLCLSDCDYDICQGDWMPPPVLDTPMGLDGTKTWNKFYIQSELNPDWTNYCSGDSCGTDDVEKCCVPVKKCADEDRFSLCREDKHNRKLIPNATCSNFECTPDSCCEVVECICTGGTPKPATSCSKHQAHECQYCDENSWKSGLTCNDMTQCTAEQYEIIPPTPRLRDRVCANLTVCKPNEYVSTNETIRYANKDSKVFNVDVAVRNRECTTRRECTGDEYQPFEPTEYEDTTCLKLTECKDYQYGDVVLKGGKAVSDAICKDRTICKQNEYIVTNGNRTANRICDIISGPCPKDTVEVREPVPGIYNRICLAPYECKSYEYETEPPTNITNRKCALLSNCSLTQYEILAPTETSDRKCNPLTRCTSREYEETSAVPGKTDRTCTDIRECDIDATPPQYEFTAPTSTSDRICAECTDSTCKGCMTVNDCMYDEDVRIHVPEMCAGVTCTRYKVGGTNTNIIFEPAMEPLEYGSYYRFDVVSADMTFVLTGIDAHQALVLKNSRTLKSSTSTVDIKSGEYLYFGIPLNHAGAITYRPGRGTAINFGLQRDCVQTEKFVGSKTGEPVCTSVCGNPGAILTQRTTVYSRIADGKECQPVWTSTPCMCVADGECPDDFEGTCVYEDCKCPVDCEYTEDTDFGPCDAPCGEQGFKFRRINVTKSAKHDGKKCPDYAEKQMCEGEIPQHDCDCYGNREDLCGVCGGTNECKGCDGIYYNIPGYKKPIVDRCGNCHCLNEDNPKCASEEQKESCPRKLKLLAEHKTDRSASTRQNAPLIVGFILAGIFVIIIACVCRPKKKLYLPVSTVYEEGEFEKEGQSFNNMDGIIQF